MTLPTLNNRKVKKYEAPIADFIIENRKRLQSNFHALPIFNLAENLVGYEKYKDLFGKKYFSAETTITGKIFDSFFYPTRCIKKSQNYTAETFGSNDTLFVTCGTSISNQIVIDALVTENSHVLIDRETHQSMHFAVKAKRASFDYFYSEIYCEATERKYIKLDSLLGLVQNSIENKRPYDFIILSAASYDGVIYNIYKIIKNIYKISPLTKFIVDEAWSSAFYFHPALYKFTAGYAAKAMKNKVDIVATQSAHKSLMALRQASYIHSFANPDITAKLYKSRFKLHSTSPNYAILASLDLARAYMREEGEKKLSQALKNVEYFKKCISNDKKLNGLIYVNNKQNISKISEEVCFDDPLKIHLNIKATGFNGQDLQEYLYNHFGIYFNRYTAQTVLLNVHIGISRKQIELLIEAFRSIMIVNKGKAISDIDDDDFIISYPPGIPLRIPGEKFDLQKIQNDIQAKIKNGINVFQLT